MTHIARMTLIAPAKYKQKLLLVGFIVTGALVSVLASGFWKYFTPVDATGAMAKGRYEMAHKFYSADADTGNPDALNALGNLYYLGLGVEINPVKASQLYFEAAGLGHSAAQLNLGHLYKQGLGVNTDATRAFAWYRMADIHGSPWAEYYISHAARENILTPMQMSTAAENFATLGMLIQQGL
ncbi:MAG: tetratricopeptide repeat protein [Granulosicoccus sp.]